MRGILQGGGDRVHKRAEVRGAQEVPGPAPRRAAVVARHEHRAQGLYGVTPDITTLGKIVGGGMPVGAIAASREVMEQLSPTGPIYQAGTLSGNPLSVAAGLALLDALAEDEETIYERLEQAARRLTDGIAGVLAARDIPHTLPRVGSMFSLYFRAEPVRNFDDARAADGDRFRVLFHGLLERGVALAPSPFEAGFVSAAHDDGAIDETIEAFRAVAPHP